jgi:hypothetical protein
MKIYGNMRVKTFQRVIRPSYVFDEVEGRPAFEARLRLDFDVVKTG